MEEVGKQREEKVGKKWMRLEGLEWRKRWRIRDGEWLEKNSRRVKISIIYVYVQSPVTVIMFLSPTCSFSRY